VIDRPRRLAILLAAAAAVAVRHGRAAGLGDIHRSRRRFGMYPPVRVVIATRPETHGDIPASILRWITLARGNRFWLWMRRA
jgi:hypothetical protein